jgi:hypothetical protein
MPGEGTPDRRSTGPRRTPNNCSNHAPATAQTPRRLGTITGRTVAIIVGIVVRSDREAAERSRGRQAGTARDWHMRVRERGVIVARRFCIRLNENRSSWAWLRA